MKTILWSFLILGSLGLIFGVILAVASKVFYVKTDTRVEDVKKMLPNYNCGACGFAGCSGFAEAIVKGEEVKLSGFGIFEKKARKERRGTNPSDGSIIIIPAKSTITFRPSKTLKAKVN